MMKTNLLLSSLLLLTTACSQPTVVTPSPAPSVSPSPASLVGRWRWDERKDVVLEFTASGTFLDISAASTDTGKYEILSGGRVLMRYDNGKQYVEPYSIVGNKLTIDGGTGAHVLSHTP